MKRLYFVSLICFFLFSFVEAKDFISVDGKDYRMVMLDYPHTVGAGVIFYSYRLPDYPLEVSIMEIDVKNNHIAFEACLSKDSTLNLETVKSMAKRKSYEGHQVVGAINGDFFTMTGDMAGTTCNGSMCNGKMGVIPSSFGPMFAFDLDNDPYIDDMRFSGKITYNGETIVIDNVNTQRASDKLILYTYLNGKRTKTNQYGTEVVISLKEGNVLSANADLPFVVKKVNKDMGNTSLNEDEFVISGHGVKAHFLNKLEVGDELILSVGISLLNDTDLLPKITNMIGSNCVFLKNGEKVPVTVSSGAPGSPNPRTAAGYSADKSKVYFCVVDGRTTRSKGVTINQLADLMKQAGASTAMNFDGGGSSILLVRGEAGNTPLENRSVANAYLVVSSGEEDKTINDIELFTEELTAYYGKKYQLSVSTLNKNGGVIDYLSAKDVIYKVIGDIGTVTIDGLFSASGEDDMGYIVAEYDGLQDSMKINLLAMEQIAFTHHELTIDHLHDYTFTVEGFDNMGTSYILDNELVKFESKNEKVGIINEHGIFTGLSSGRTEIEVSTLDGKFKDLCTVNVEIGNGEIILDDFDAAETWQVVAKDFITDVEKTDYISENGDRMLKVDYTMTYQKRTATIELAKVIDIYGIPEAFELEMISNGRKSSVSLEFDADNGSFASGNFTDNELKLYHFELPYSKFIPESYPLTFKSLRLQIAKDNVAYLPDEVYTGTFYLNKLKAVYSDVYPESVIDHNSSELINIVPNPNNGIFRIIDKEKLDDVKSIRVYNLVGQLVFLSETENSEVDVRNLPDGTYLCMVMTENNKYSICKIQIIK